MVRSLADRTFQPRNGHVLTSLAVLEGRRLAIGSDGGILPSPITIWDSALQDTLGWIHWVDALRMHLLYAWSGAQVLVDRQKMIPHKDSFPENIVVDQAENEFSNFGYKGLIPSDYNTCTLITLMYHVP